MKVKIKRMDKNLPLPKYEGDAACFDFICRKDTEINPGEIGLVPTNLVVMVPKGFVLLVFPRSSTALKKKLVLANGVGVVDPFPYGDEDEIILQFLNIGKEPVLVKKGEELAQGMIVKTEKAAWEEVEKTGNKGDGGYWAVKEVSLSL